MAAMMLRGWWPKSVTDFLLATTLGRATAWVGTEAIARHAAKGGGGGASPRCRTKWLPFPRRKCDPPPPPSPPPPPPSPLAALCEQLDFELIAYAIGASPLLLIVLLSFDRGQYGPGQRVV